MDKIFSPKEICKILLQKGVQACNLLKCTENITWGMLLINQTDKPKETVLANLQKAASLLEVYRKKYLKNLKIRITSAWRSDSYNKKIGGAPSSYHVLGMAVDFVCEGIQSSMVQKILDPVHNGGLEFAKGWTHIDIRPYRARFYE